jgi:hypothetical protein
MGFARWNSAPPAKKAAQENIMAPRHITLAFATLLASAPLIGANAAAQQPGPERAQTTERTESPQVYRTNDRVPAVPNVDPSVPTTPMPMSLPDRVGANEIENEYGVGVAGLIIGAVFIAAIVIGALFLISRRSWSTQH